MAFTFRKMTLEDVEEVHGLERKVEETPWSRENFSSSIKDGHAAYVGILDGEIASWFVVMPAFDVCELLIIGVKDELRGLGYGRKTLAFAMEVSADAGFSAMLLEVRESNAPAIGLYKSSGFESVGIRKNYYVKANGRENAVLMTRSFLS